MLREWWGLAAYLFLWCWVMSPWLRFALLPGLWPTRRVALWDGPPFGYVRWPERRPVLPAEAS